MKSVVAASPAVASVAARRLTTMRLRLLPRADLAAVRGCDALATSANAALCGNSNPNFWRFSGRRNADGAVRAAGGRALDAACHDIPLIEGCKHTRCRPGSAVATAGAFGSLDAGLVIHAVSPNGAYGYSQQRWFGPNGTNVWNGVDDSPDVPARAPPPGEAGDQLVATAAAILREAEAHGARSLALPAIGCGVMGWTPSRASQLVLRAIGAHEPQSLERIDVALYDDAIFAAYVAAAAELATVEEEAADGTRTFRLAGAPT